MIFQIFNGAMPTTAAQAVVTTGTAASGYTSTGEGTITAIIEI